MKPDVFLQSQSHMEPEKKLNNLVKVLTGPQGCAWDQKQTARSIIDFVIDEAHELKSALEEDNIDEVCSELGDLLFTVEFLAQSLHTRTPKNQAADRLVEKMVRRHPHVFTDLKFANEGELKKNWELEKRKENSQRKRFDQDIPASLPPLQRATKVLSRAMNAGFSYHSEMDAWDKVCEELSELEAALQMEQSDVFQEELGDLFLSLLTLAKMKGVNAGDGLKRSTTKLCDRLQLLEEKAGRPLQSIPRQELAPLYAQVKSRDETDGAFFNYCGVSPWPRPVRKAVRRAGQMLARDGLSAALSLREERESLRPRIASFCGASKAASVVYLPNVSSAALGVAYCQDWSAGDAILLGQNEFPANVVPWKSAAATFQLQVSWFDEDLLRRDPKRGWDELRNCLEVYRPKLMALSAVSFWSGFRYPVKKIAELCKDYGVKLFVDGIQALGTVPLKMEGIDFLAGGSHKALFAPEAAGFLVVEERQQREWVPRLSSWLSLPEPVDFLTQGVRNSIPNRREPREGDPSTLEGGSLNSLGYAGLAASIDYLSELGVDKIFSQIQELQDPLEQALSQRGWRSLRAPSAEGRSAILSFEPPGGVKVGEIQQFLNDRQISVGIPNGCLRFGFHTFTRAEEVERAIQALTH